MAIITRSVIEFLTLIETARKNLHDVAVKERLDLLEVAKTQHIFCEVAERLILSEKTLFGGIYDLSIQETLTLFEIAKPRVWVFNIYEGLVLLEHLSHVNLIETLTLVESLIFEKIKVAKENLPLNEVLSFTISRNMISNEFLQLKEGLSAYKVDTTGAMTNIVDPFCDIVTTPAIIFGIVVQESPFGAINGINKDFVLTYTPIQTASLQVYINGILQRKGALYDYIFTAPTLITFSNAPLAGDTIMVYYLK